MQQNIVYILVLVTEPVVKSAAKSALHLVWLRDVMKHLFEQMLSNQCKMDWFFFFNLTNTRRHDIPCKPETTALFSHPSLCIHPFALLWHRIEHTGSVFTHIRKHDSLRFFTMQIRGGYLFPF